MNIECEICHPVFKIKDEIIPPDGEVKYTCKNCRPVNAAAYGRREPAQNDDLAASDHSPAASVPRMADNLATTIGIGYDSDEVLYQLEVGTMDFLHLERTDLGPLVSKITESVDKVSMH